MVDYLLSFLIKYINKFLLLTDILSNENLVGTYYMACKRKLNLILIVDEVEWILETPLLDNYTAKKEYDHRHKSNQKARAFILVGMSDVLTTQVEHHKVAKDILMPSKRCLEVLLI